jgi:hypothetical protein
MIEHEAAEVLDQAHDLLMVTGWCQGFFRKGGSHCAVGAIAATLGQLDVDNNGYLEPPDLNRQHLAIQAVAATIPNPVYPADPASTVTVWNDDPERTVDEVLDAFRHAAKNLRNAA